MEATGPCWQLYQEPQDAAGATIELEEAERMSPPSHSSSKDDSTGDGQHRNQAEAERGFRLGSEQEELYLLYKNVPIVKIKD